MFTPALLEKIKNFLITRYGTGDTVQSWVGLWISLPVKDETSPLALAVFNSTFKTFQDAYIDGNTLRWKSGSTEVIANLEGINGLCIVAEFKGIQTDFVIGADHEIIEISSGRNMRKFMVTSEDIPNRVIVVDDEHGAKGDGIYV